MAARDWISRRFWHRPSCGARFSPPPAVFAAALRAAPDACRFSFAAYQYGARESRHLGTRSADWEFNIINLDRIRN